MLALWSVDSCTMLALWRKNPTHDDMKALWNLPSSASVTDKLEEPNISK